MERVKLFLAKTIVFGARHPMMVAFFIFYAIFAIALCGYAWSKMTLILISELVVLVFASGVATYGYLTMHDELRGLLEDSDWNVAVSEFRFGWYPIWLIILFCTAVVTITVAQKTILFIVVMVGVFFVYCRSNIQYHKFFASYHDRFRPNRSAQVLSLLAQNVHFFREENYAAVLSYFAMACLYILATVPFANMSPDSLVALPAGAAILHLTLSGFRFVKLLDFRIQNRANIENHTATQHHAGIQNHTDKNVFDILSKWISLRPSALNDLLNVSKIAFDTRFKCVMLVFKCSVAIFVGTVLFSFAPLLLRQAIGLVWN